MLNNDEDYDRMWDLLELLLVNWRSAGIDDVEALSAITDFLTINAIAVGESSGESEKAVEGVMERMQHRLSEWRNGEPPFAPLN